MRICFTPAAIRRRGTPPRARSWSSATPQAPTRIHYSGGPTRSVSASPARLPIPRRSWTARPWSARPVRSSRGLCANSRLSTKQGPYPADSLPPRLPQRRHPGQDDLDSRAAAGLGIEIEPAAEAIGHDAVDDMQAEPGAPLAAARGEERIAGAATDVEAHADAVVGKQDLDIVLAGFPHLDVDRAGLAVRKGMRHRIEEQVGQHLSVGPGIAVHGEIGLAVDVQRQIVLPQARPQAHHHLLGQIAEVEGALIRVIAGGRG